MKKLRFIFVIIAITGITGFQLYWLKNNYDREKQNLAIETHASFRQTILHLQASKLKLEDISFIHDSVNIIRRSEGPKRMDKVTIRTDMRRKDPAITMMNLLQERMKDSVKNGGRQGGNMIISLRTDSGHYANIDSFKRKIQEQLGRKNGNNSTKIDSLFPDPEKIKSIDADTKEGHGNNSITVIYGDKEKRKNEIPPDDIFLENSNRHLPGSANRMAFRLLYDIDSVSVKDTVTVKEITEAYKTRLKEDKINVGFAVSRLDSNTTATPDAVTIGFSQPTNFNLLLTDTMSYLFKKLGLPILFSIILVGITMASFIMLYRNIRRQQRLAELKNEFISNITHELKTPIATVGVAIEALKNFNAIDNPERTREYLDISQNELQRLSLLVDKVLKLSMFEKKEIELKYEPLNVKAVVEEVTNSMRLQLEKHHAVVSIHAAGNLDMQGDKLHLQSVVFNLLDNAIKYGNQNPVIKIDLAEENGQVVMSVTDNGMGIAPEYKDKVFEKFFRIPHGDTHNAKGYGLGLSYAAQVIKKHKGTISVETVPDGGAKFIIHLPKTLHT